MVRKEPWEALKEYFYKKVFPKPQKIYKQLSNTYKAIIGYDKLFVIVLLYSLYIYLRLLKETFEEFPLESLSLLTTFFDEGLKEAQKKNSRKNIGSPSSKKANQKGLKGFQRETFLKSFPLVAEGI